MSVSTLPVTVLTHLAPGLPTELFQALADLIGTALDRPARLRVDSATSGPQRNAPEPFSTGDVDVAFVCGTSYTWLREHEPCPVDLAGAAWVPVDARCGGKPVYFTDVVVREDDDRDGVASLPGARIGCNDRASLSGFHALRIELQRLGLPLQGHWRQVVTGGHRQSIEALLAGEVDAAALDSIVLHGQRERRPEVAALRTAATIGPFPVQPVIVSSGLADAERLAIRDALLGAARHIPDALDRAGLAGFAEIDDSAYDALAGALAAAERTTPV